MKKIVLIVCAMCCVALFFVIFSKKQDSPESVPKGNNSISVKEEQVPLLFVGDIMVGRFVETLAEKYNNPSFMFASTSDFLKRHIVIANLEGTIPLLHNKTPINGFSFSFASSAPLVLKENGITAVSLANNHSYDNGKVGYEETVNNLKENGVISFGGYDQKENVFITKLADKKVVVYGITMISSLWDEQETLFVTSKIVNEHKDDHVIAFIHWGDEYVTQNKYQRDFAYKLIDRGVDTVVGSHPHIVQGIELYKEKPIFYSLGNFIFDQYWRSDLEDGYMLRMLYATSSVIYEIIPIHSQKSVPFLAEGDLRNRIVSSIAVQSSADLQESIKKGFIFVPR
jgi:poly-gamma-glutamate synthesis protein (capsule biosynthesis protein)